MNYKQIIYISLVLILIISVIVVSIIYFPDKKKYVSDEDVTKIQYVSHISNAQQKVIDNFNKIYEGRIKVESINLPFEKFSTNERKDLLARYLRSKSDRIDVFTVDQVWVPRFARWALSLNIYFSNTETSNILQYAIQTCFFNDTLVAVPLYIDVSVMFYRDDMLKKLKNYNSIRSKIKNSISWHELIKMKNDLRNRSDRFFLFPADSYEGLICMFVEMMESQGRSLIEKDNLQLTSVEASNSLKLMVDLVNKYQVTPSEVVNYRENEVYREFINDKGVFLRGWPAFLNEYSELNIDSKLMQNTDMAITPHFENGQPTSTFGGWNLMISKFTPNMKESIIFIKYLLSKEAQSILSNEGGYIPINNSLYKDGKNEKLRFYQKVMKTGVHRPFLKNYTKISDIIVEHLNKAIKKEISVEKALQDAQRIILNEKIEIK